MRVKHGVVVVEVSGGVVCASLISPGVRLIIVDHDNMDAYEVRGDFRKRPAHYPPDTVLDPRG